MHGFVGNVRIFLIPRTFVVLRPVRLPIAEAHPAEVVLAVEALHVVTAAVLFDANVTLRAVLRVGTDVVGRFAVVGAFGQPLADDLAIGWSMIVGTTAEAKRTRTHLAGGFLRADVRAADDYLKWYGN